MIASNGIEHWDGFDDNIIFWCEVKDIPIDCIYKAKQIDKDNYREDCFGVCVGFSDKGFYVIEDTPGYELYYIDNEGNKNYMNIRLHEYERENIFTECRNEILRIMGNM